MYLPFEILKNILILKSLYYWWWWIKWSTGTHLTFPKAKIFSINLSETFIHDYLILKNSNLYLINSVELVEEQSQQQMKKLFLIPSNIKNFINNKEIDLFINIASFQEMSMLRL